MDILKCNSEEIVEHYFDKIQADMNSGKPSAFMSIKIAYRYFKERKVTNSATIHLLADKLQDKHQLLQLIIQELCRYSAFVNTKVDEEIKAAEASEKAFDDSKLHEKIYEGVFPHQEQITERFEFLTLFAQECSSRLSKDQLAQLWTNLVDRNQIKFDKKQLFLMLKNFVNVAIGGEDDNKVIVLEELCAFYRDSIAHGVSDYSSLDLEGAICLISFFILINSQQGRLQVLQDDKSAATNSHQKSILKNSTGTDTNDKITSINSNGVAVSQNLSFAQQTTQITTTATATQSSDAVMIGPVRPPAKTTANAASSSSLVNKDGFVNLVMCVPPEEVEGTASLWRIATQAIEIKVHEAAVALLIQIHTSL